MYAVPFRKPLNVAPSDEVLWVALPLPGAGEIITSYRDTGEPGLVGAVHDTLTWPSPETSVGGSGLSGIVHLDKPYVLTGFAVYDLNVNRIIVDKSTDAQKLIRRGMAILQTASEHIRQQK